MTPVDGLCTWLRKKGLPRHIRWNHLPNVDGTAATMVAHSDQAIAYLHAEGLLNRKIGMLLNTPPRTRAEAIARLNELIPQENRNDFATRLFLVERINEGKVKDGRASVFSVNERLATAIICQAVKQAEPLVVRWFSQTDDDIYSFAITYQQPLGEVYTRQAMTGSKLLVTSTPTPTGKLRVVLARNRQLNIIQIKTAYPDI